MPKSGRSTHTWPIGQPSDEALADSLQEILAISTRLLHDLRIVAVFDFHLLKGKFHSDLRFESSLYEGPSTLGESAVTIPLCYRQHRRKPGCGFACVLAKLRSGQTVVSTLCFFSAKQRRHRESPWTVRARPAIHVALHPDQRAFHIGNPSHYRNEQ